MNSNDIKQAFDDNWWIIHLYKNLKSLVKHVDDTRGIRYAGALEILLIKNNFLEAKAPFDYLKGGLKYVPYILDFRWTESYARFILRIADDYIKFNKLYVD